MRTAGIYLIFAAVVLRGVVLFYQEQPFGAVLGLLAMYGLLLFVETWIMYRMVSNVFRSRYAQLAYLILQSVIVIWLLAITASEDFFTLLFIPLSLDAVSFFGRRYGYLTITIFSMALTGMLMLAEEGPLFGLAMGAFYSGMCFLFGGYAHQVQKAETAHTQNQRMFNELESAYRQLQGYADQVSNLAVEHERNRLARDLHDSVTQTVFSMNLTAQSARLLLDREPARATGQLFRLEELAASALSEIQSLVSQLRPRSIKEEGLPAALHRLAAERESREGLKVSLEVHGTKTLSEAEAVGLYAIAHEALVNVSKHSGAHEALICLTLNEHGSCLEIQDHGLGFDPQLPLNRAGHLGLAAISERAQEIGWTLSVESRPGQGTRVRVVPNQPEGPK